MKIRLLIATSLIAITAAPAYAQRPNHMPLSDYQAMIFRAGDLLDLPASSTVNLDWRSEQTGHSGVVVPIGATRQASRGTDCRSFLSTYSFRTAGAPDQARLRGEVCRTAGRVLGRGVRVEQGLLTRDIGRPAAPPPPPPPPPPQVTESSTQYNNELGHGCTLTVQTTTSSGSSRSVERRQCVDENGQTYEDQVLPPPAPPRPYQNVLGDPCEQRQDTVVISRRKQRVEQKVCQSWLGGTYADDDDAEVGPDVQEGIKRLLRKFLYIDETVASQEAFRDALKKASTDFIADQRLADVTTPSKLLAALNELDTRMSETETASCDVLDDENERDEDASAEVCITLE